MTVLAGGLGIFLVAVVKVMLGEKGRKTDER